MELDKEKQMKNAKLTKKNFLREDLDEKQYSFCMRQMKNRAY